MSILGTSTTLRAEAPSVFYSPLSYTGHQVVVCAYCQGRTDGVSGLQPVYHRARVLGRGATGKKIEAALVEPVGARRTSPRDDPMSLLVHGSFADGSLIPYDVLDMCWLLYIAGLDTVHAGLGHSFRYLGEHAELGRQLADDLTLIPAAVEELLRWHSWVNPSRTVRVDCDLYGIQLKKGDKICALAVLADRDPQAYDEPEKVDFHRNRKPPLGVRGRTHRCVGSHLARRELTIEIEAWIRRIPDFYILEEQIPNLRYATLGMWSPPHLPLRWRVPELTGN
jgi:cytochrome P450